MPKRSAGLLMYRWKPDGIEVFLVHLGGPYWANNDQGAWTIPKGEYDDEEPFAAAQREFFEETGFTADGEASWAWLSSRYTRINQSRNPWVSSLKETEIRPSPDYVGDGTRHFVVCLSESFRCEETASA